MKRTIPKQSGSITTEYLVVSIVLMIPIWYAFVGGSGDWTDTEHEPNLGTYQKSGANMPVEPSAFVRTLNEREHSFVQGLYHP